MEAPRVITERLMRALKKLGFKSFNLTSWEAGEREEVGPFMTLEVKETRKGIRNRTLKEILELIPSKAAGLDLQAQRKVSGEVELVLSVAYGGIEGGEVE